MLYVIPTPIWNLDDITLRALKLFKELKYFICEDTRTFKNLLRAYDIDFSDKKFFSLTSYTDPGVIKKYINLVKENDVWLVSEAGTPGLSDPGKELIKHCWQEGIDFEVLPGANALIPAVVASCFPTDKFCFYGFLPQKKGREKILKEILTNNKAVFFYESVHRLKKLFDQLNKLEFRWKIFIWRELTKKFQQYLCWDFEKIYYKLQKGDLILKWEFVVWIFK